MGEAAGVVIGADMVVVLVEAIGALRPRLRLPLLL